MRIHRNLHNAKAGGPQWVETRKGRVHQYLDTVILGDVSTRIQRGGAGKCKTSGVRSVVAFLDGIRVDEVTGMMGGRQPGWQRLAYDPRVDEEFLVVEPDGSRRRWNTALAVALMADGSAWVNGATWRN